MTSTLHRLARLSITAAPILLLLGGSAAAAPDIGGRVDIAAVQTETADREEDTLRQEDFAAWRHAFLPRLTARATFRYYRYDIDQGPTLDSRREELQPAAELDWRHPDFVFGADWRRRETELSDTPGTLVADNTHFSLQTLRSDLPLLRADYSVDEVLDRTAVGGRNTRNEQLRASVDQVVGWTSLSYSLNRAWLENVVSGLQSDRTEHRARIVGDLRELADDRLSLGGTSTYRRFSMTDESLTGDVLLETLIPAAGLRALDPTPDRDPLAPAPALIDGDLGSPVLPEIDLGGAGADWNLGVDLGFAREVAAVYVFTDRVSGSGLEWSVYVSADNEVWTEAQAFPAFVFNPAQRRYEITFQAVSARYVKAVSRGVNEVARALVTEIQVFLPRPGVRRETRSEDMHLADLSARYLLSDRVKISGGGSYLYQQGGSLPDGRRNADASLRLNVRQGGFVEHSLGGTWSRQSAGGAVQDLDSRSLSYGVVARPLPTLSSRFSASRREERVDGERTQLYHSLSAGADGSPLRLLTASIDAGYVRSDLDAAGGVTDTWSARSRLSGPLASSFIVTLGFGVRRTDVASEPEARVRRDMEFSGDLRLSRTVHMRGSLNLVDDRQDNVSQNYLLSWTPIPKASLTGQAYILEAENVRTVQFSANLNYNLSPRSNLYIRYSELDYSEAGGQERNTLQQGLRIGF